MGLGGKFEWSATEKQTIGKKRNSSATNSKLNTKSDQTFWEEKS